MDLQSKVFSTETLMAGATLVKEEIGMDSLDAMGVEELEEELAALEAAYMEFNIYY